MIFGFLSFLCDFIKSDFLAVHVLRRKLFLSQRKEAFYQLLHLQRGNCTRSSIPAEDPALNTYGPRYNPYQSLNYDDTR